jgi:hypothetical protein
LPPSTFSKVFITSKTLLLISSFERPAEAAYPLADNVSAGRAKERVGWIRGAEATRKEGAALAIAVRNIVYMDVWMYGMGYMYMMSDEQTVIGRKGEWR